MIWEVDNDGDGKVNFADVWTALQRVHADREGTEPDSLVNVVEFAMYDPGQTGTISCEECMLILSKRFDVKFSGADVRSFVLDSTVTDTKRVNYKEFLRQLAARKALHLMR